MSDQDFVGLWCCRWGKESDDPFTPVVFGNIIGLSAGLPGRLDVAIHEPLMAPGVGSRWHKANLLTTYATVHEAMADRMAIKAIRATADQCVASPSAKRLVYERTVKMLLNGQIK